MSTFETGAEEAAYDLGVQHGEEMGISKGETQAEERIIKLLEGKGVVGVNAIIALIRKELQ